MTGGGTEGVVAGLWRFPVKSMGGERLASVEVTERGVVGDRAYALIDTETGKVVSGKSVKRFPHVAECRAAFVEPPWAGGPSPPVRIALADGTQVQSDAEDADAVLSAFFGRRVALAAKAPDDFTVDQYYPDVEGASPGNRDTTLEQKLGAALFAAMGVESPVPAGSFQNGFPLSVLTTSTLAQLGTDQPGSRFDERRFRMNLIVETRRPGFVENDWIGRGLGLGDGVRLRVVIPDPRCVVVTLAQDELPQDTGVLRALVRHNKIPVGGFGEFPCAGVYAVVAAGGVARVGDPVVLR